MAKEPRNPTGGGDSADDRQKAWEQHAFGAEDAPSARTEGPIGDDIAAVVHEAAEELGEVLHAKFVQLLNAKLGDQDGRLTPADVAEMGAEFRRELQVIETVFLDAIENYTKAGSRDRKTQDRSHFFFRLMVRKFENLFTDERTLKEKPELLSRRMLPGFFNMLGLMFGKPKLEAYEQQSKKVADRLNRERGPDFDWTTFYRESESTQIALRAELEIARYFGDTEKRLRWMIALVNSNLIPPKETVSGTPWSLNQGAAEKMLEELFRDVGTALRNEPSRQAVAKQMGPETVETLDKVARRFG